MSYVPADTEGTLSCTVTRPDTTGIPGATVALTTIEGAEMNTTKTDSTGHYAFANVFPDFCNINATKRSYWSDTNPVTVTAEEPITADIVLCQKGDLNTNGGFADANRRLSNDGGCNRSRNIRRDIRPGR